MTVGELVFKLTLDTSEFDNGLKKAVTNAESMGQEVTKHTSAVDVALGNMLSGFTEFLTRFTMDIPRAVVDASAEVQAENEAFKATFGDLASSASVAFSGIGDELNILAPRLNRVATQTFAQFRSAGLDAEDALTSTERVLRLAADGAAFYDITLEEATSRMRSFIRGNVEAGEAIGLFTTATQRDIDAATEYGAAWKELTEDQRESLMVDVIERLYEQSGAIGQAAREMDNWQNATANAAEAQRQIQAVLGGPLMQSLIPSVEKFTTWLTQDNTISSLSTFAEKVGNLAGVTLEGVTTAFDWMANNGEAVEMGLEAIALGLGAAFAAAHPLAASLAAVATLLTQISGGHNYNQEFFSGYSEEELQTLQRYVDAWNKLSDAELQANVYQTADAITAYTQAQQEFNAASAAAGEVDGLLGSYHSWLTTQGHTGDQPYLDVPVNAVLSEDSEGNLQAAVAGMELDGEAALYADPKSRGLLQAYLDSLNLSVAVDLIASGLDMSGIPGHASGLDRVPYDNYLARLHEGEAVLTKSEATSWRAGESRQKASAEPVVINQYITVDHGEDFEQAVKNAIELLQWQG